MTLVAVRAAMGGGAVVIAPVVLQGAVQGTCGGDGVALEVGGRTRLRDALPSMGLAKELQRQATENEAGYDWSTWLLGLHKGRSSQPGKASSLGTKLEY